MTFNILNQDCLAYGGEIEELEELVNAGHKLNESAIHGAVGGNRLEILKWLREHDCPWHEQTCELAAELGHFDILKWALENGCSADYKKCLENAEKGNHQNIAQWIEKNGGLAI